MYFLLFYIILLKFCTVKPYLCLGQPRSPSAMRLCPRRSLTIRDLARFCEICCIYITYILNYQSFNIFLLFIPFLQYFTFICHCYLFCTSKSWHQQIPFQPFKFPALFLRLAGLFFLEFSTSFTFYNITVLYH